MSVGLVQRKKPGRKPDPNGRRGMAFGLKGRPEWKVWVEQYARYRRVTAPDLIHVALAAMAAADGFRPPPER